MSNFNFHPFSDFALHHMGSTLADGVSQGVAGPDEFRTAPLWNVGQRLFFLHDGRTKDLLVAIKEHSSPAADCITTTNSQNFKVNGMVKAPATTVHFCGSEANAVTANFFALTAAQQARYSQFSALSLRPDIATYCFACAPEASLDCTVEPSRNEKQNRWEAAKTGLSRCIIRNCPYGIWQISETLAKP
jgi:hypothetical protein